MRLHNDKLRGPSLHPDGLVELDRERMALADDLLVAKTH
jgi:hypothetical protein